MKNSLKILFITLLILSSNNANAKISDDLRKGARELKQVPGQLLAIPPSLSVMYQQFTTTKNEIQENILEIDNAKSEIDDIKKMLTDNKQILSLPNEERQNLQNALNSLTEDDGSGALDNLKEVLVGVKKRMSAIIKANTPQEGHTTTYQAIFMLTANAAGAINKKRRGKTLPQRMEEASNLLSKVGQ